MKKPANKGGGKHLDDDDHALWSHAARSVIPLSRAKGRHHPAAETAKEAATRVREPQKLKDEKKTKASVTPPPRSVAKPVAKAAPPLAPVDRKRVRKIRTGQVEIEARIDLHGLRQDEAHAALIRFLHRCQARDQRWVLVITGKGRASDGSEQAPFDPGGLAGRGVLKRNVPRWLEQPDLRPLVVSFTTAAATHGGEGALYVHLRKRR